MGLAVDPAFTSTVYAGTCLGGIFKTTNGGSTWTAVNNGLTTLDVKALAIDPTTPMTVYAGTLGGWAPPPAALDVKPLDIGGEKIVIQRVPDAGVNELRKMMDGLIKKKKHGAAILAGGGEKPTFVIGVREDVVKAKGLKAGDLAKVIGKACGGGGGGKETQAQAGAGDASKIDLGFETFEAQVRLKLDA